MSAEVLLWIAAGSAVAAVAAVTAAHLLDMRRAYGRIRGRSAVVPSPYGDIDHTEGGSGSPVLVIHGSGGGYDQGELLVKTVLDERFRWITPSRFGYLRSTFREGATFDDQAHAYACLLDHLGVERAAVVALSHGGPSALLFAALHPERVSSLTLISCGVASADGEEQARADRRGDLLVTVFKHDWLYWTVSKLCRRRLVTLMGAGGEVVSGLTTEQRSLVDRVIDGMNPVAPRFAGAAFDNQATMPSGRIAAVRAPTLILHAEDDKLQLFHNAEVAAATIPDARLIRFGTGGHLVLAVEQAAIRKAVQSHILENAGERPPRRDAATPRGRTRVAHRADIRGMLGGVDRRDTGRLVGQRRTLRGDAPRRIARRGAAPPARELGGVVR